MSTPVVWVFAHCRNEATIAPFWLRHYAAFADQIRVFDDGSDDGTREIIRAHPKATLHEIDMGGLDEDALLHLAHQNYPLARGHADFVMWVDMDEFIYHPRILECLAHHRARGHKAIRTVGFNMMGADLPADDGHSQLTDIYRTGVRAPVYSKTVVFDPSCHIEWSRGKHFLNSPGMSISPEDDGYQPNAWRLKLLHYRYLTPAYTRARNARQFDRCLDKNVAWSNRPDYTGEHSPEWVQRTMHLVRDVVNLDACYLPPPFDA